MIRARGPGLVYTAVQSFCRFRLKSVYFWVPLRKFPKLSLLKILLIAKLSV